MDSSLGYHTAMGDNDENHLAYSEDEHVEEGGGEEEAPVTIRVIAPASLGQGYTFDVIVDEAPYTVEVPKGGVKEGQEFEVLYEPNRQPSRKDLADWINHATGDKVASKLESECSSGVIYCSGASGRSRHRWSKNHATSMLWPGLKMLSLIHI